MHKGPENPANAIGEAQSAQIGDSTGAIKHGHAAEIEVTECRPWPVSNDGGDVFPDEGPGLFGRGSHAGEGFAVGRVAVAAEITGDSDLRMISDGEVVLNDHATAAVDLATCGFSQLLAEA